MKRQKITLIQATKYRKGACENCGSLTHARRDCLERPRKIGAKWSGRDIAPDEIVVQSSSSKGAILPGVKQLSDYDAKRDHWKHFESENFDQVAGPLYQGPFARRFQSQSDETEQVVSQKLDFESKSRMTVRNLRIREDTAKYLQRDLSQEIVYDPKTRALLKDQKNELPQERWVRASFSDATNQALALDQFCWDRKSSATQISPTEAALVYQNKEQEGKGHSEVWGSYWKNGSWGYACCKSLNRYSPCACK